MEYDPRRMCELIVGLGDVEVLGVEDEQGAPLRIHVRCRAPRPLCGGCGGPLWSNGERRVELVDLPALGRPAALVWHKRRWRCGNESCEAGYVSEQAQQIAPARALLTSRAARWATRQAGRGRPLTDIAAELGCAWHTVNTSLGLSAARRRYRPGRRGAGAGTRRDPVRPPRPVPGQDLVHQHRRRRTGPTHRRSPRPYRQSPCPVAVGTAVELAWGHRLGASLGRCLTCLARTGQRSTRRCRTPGRSRTRSTS